MKIIKPWTILIYANGNNDLEPEISQSLLDMERVGTGENVHVIVQLARAPAKLVQTLRPHHSGPKDIDGDWSGVRRYRIKENPSVPGKRKFYSELVADLGNANMADPATLRDFICWGATNFPARHYMLILVGHGAGIAGALPDFTYKCPQIMTITGIKAAINHAARETGKTMDILVFDSCYMNMVEIIYELGIGSKSPGFVIAPEVTPLKGLPYETILGVLRGISKKDSPQALIRKLVNEVNRVLIKRGITLFAFRLNSGLLWCIKRIISNIARLIIKHKINLNKYTNPSQPGFPAFDLDKLTKFLEAKPTNLSVLIHTWLLKKYIKLLILPWHPERFKTRGSTSLCIYLPNNNHFLMMARYYTKMRFTHENQWLKLLSSKPVGSNFNTITPYAFPEPEDMPLEGMLHVITALTPGLSPEEINTIIEDLGWSNCPKLQRKETI